MWEPEPDWHPLPGGTGTSTVGVWRAAVGDQPVVVKRLARPAAHDPAELSDPTALERLNREGERLRKQYNLELMELDHELEIADRLSGIERLKDPPSRRELEERREREAFEREKKAKKAERSFLQRP